MKIIRVYLIGALLLFGLFSQVFTEDFENFEGAFGEDQEEDQEQPIRVQTPGTTTGDSSKEEPEIQVDVIDSEFYDEEEFIGVIPQQVPRHFRKESQAENVAPPAVPPETTPQPETPQITKSFWDRDWTVEIAFLAILALYMANFFHGQSKNQRIAQAWFTRYLPFYKQNFHLIGRRKEVLIKESNNVFSVTATGRVNCEGAHAELNLKKRQDLFSLGMNFIYPSYDTLNFIAPLPEGTTQFVFALLPASIRASFIKSHSDLSLTKRRDVPRLRDSLECYTDCQELVGSLLSEEILRIIEKNHKLFEMLYITDLHPEYATDKRILNVVFRIPEDMSDMDDLMRLCFLVMDQIATVKLSKAGSTAVKAVRQKIEHERMKETHLQRQEVAQKKKEEKDRLRREKLTPEEQEKLDEREQKRKMRKMQSKQTKRMVVF